MKTALYYSLVTGLLLNGNPAQGAEHLQSDGIHSSKTVVVESPTVFPELAMQNAEALYLHTHGDGRAFLIVEGLGGKNLSILDVSNPAHIREISHASISATAPFDFVESLNDRALLIRYRNESGLALLKFSKRDRPLITKLASSTGAGPVQIVNDRGEALLPQAEAMALPEAGARDYQVVDTSSPLEPQVVASVPGGRQMVLKSDTGTLFLLAPSGITVIRHPGVERDYEAALSRRQVTKKHVILIDEPGARPEPHARSASYTPGPSPLSEGVSGPTDNIAADSTHAVSGTALFRSNVWSDPLLDTMRNTGDILADGVIAELFARSEVAQVNALMRTLIRNEFLEPEAFPPAVHDYLGRPIDFLLGLILVSSQRAGGYLRSMVQS